MSNCYNGYMVNNNNMIGQRIKSFQNFIVHQTYTNLILISRRLFKEPEVTPAGDCDLKWEKPDEEALVKYMCEEKGFQVEIRI